MITLIFTISGEYFDMIDQDTNGEIDGQEATDAINYMIENDLMTDSKWSWKIIWNSELNFVFYFYFYFIIWSFLLEIKKQSIKSIYFHQCTYWRLNCISNVCRWHYITWIRKSWDHLVVINSNLLNCTTSKKPDQPSRTQVVAKILCMKNGDTRISTVLTKCHYSFVAFLAVCHNLSANAASYFFW